jgi:acylphosphatase
MSGVSNETIRRRLVIRGHVQGVFFRDSVRQVAESEGVAGWATNCNDGTVEVVVEGLPDAVQAVIEYCRLGPAHARVDHVDVTEEEPKGLTGFEIR